MLALGSATLLADGIYRNGVGARAMALGGADVAYASDPLGAMAANPAGLGYLTVPELNLGFNAASAYGHFTKFPTSDGNLSSKLGVFPDAAFALPLGKSPVTLGLSFVTDSALDADWHYVDPPGKPGGISYGYQRDRSEIILFRSAAGIGVALTPHWSLGANIGLVYNENRLQTPYIFQTTPGLAGAKTLLDLRTSGLGWNAQVGLLFRPNEQLEFGLSYKSETTIFSHGNATGDAGTQLGVASFPFHYEAQVKNVLPQMIAGGTSWKFCEQWRLALEVDWINWSGAFTQLPVSLKNGNSALPASLNDYVPLNWRDEFVYRAGLEYAATTNLVFRGGYSYGKSPVPDTTLTPMTGVIMEHTLTAGIGYHWRRYQIDLAYQWDLPRTRNVGDSALLAGEYSNSSTRIGVHTFALTTGIRF